MTHTTQTIRNLHKSQFASRVDDVVGFYANLALIYIRSNILFPAWIVRPLPQYFHPGDRIVSLCSHDVLFFACQLPMFNWKQRWILFDFVYKSAFFVFQPRNALIKSKKMKLRHCYKVQVKNCSGGSFPSYMHDMLRAYGRLIDYGFKGRCYFACQV